MATEKKKGDFHGASGRIGDEGGTKKAHAKPESKSRGGHTQNVGTGGRNVGKDT